MSSSNSTGVSRRFNGGRQGRGINGFRSIRMWNEAGRGPICSCGVEAVIFTSSTAENPGRRFMKCGFDLQGSGCGAWEWIDPPISETGSQLFNLMMDELLMMKAENDALKRQLETIGSGRVHADNSARNRVAGRTDGGRAEIGRTQVGRTNVWAMLVVLIVVLLMVIGEMIGGK